MTPRLGLTSSTASPILNVRSETEATVPRHKQFDTDEVLDRAVLLFWEKGYEATSVQDLVDHMSINRFSLYDTFGSKHTLFLLALKRFFGQMLEGGLAELETSREGLGSIRAFLDRWIDLLTLSTRSRGCLVINSAIELARRDPETAMQVARHMGRMEEALKAALLRARDLGEIDSAHALRDLARVVTGAVQGMSVMAKSGLDRAGLEGYATVLLATLK
jgi:TetR/AcrR family transcriptional repressor of nem operon